MEANDAHAEISRRASSLAASLLLASPAHVARRTIRSRPVQIIVGYAPGGGTDTLARVLADPLSKSSASR